MTSYYMGVFDAPGIFAIRDRERRVYYRNYERYSGANFPNISQQFVQAINTGQKQPLYANWADAHKTVMNLEHLLHNKIKIYIYGIGALSCVLIPIGLVVDCWKPLLGRGPRAKKETQGEKPNKKKKEPPMKKKIE
mmetsp:Transcript_11254/g.11300  ORF Transcript_11254/g.11300 Transcript_11254/m.11300 type:complete len:136 (-) Transcript_11254:15-422(-)